jgi:acyl dehydratase
MLDRSAIGRTTSVSTMEVEKGHIRKFAQAIGDDSPLYHDEEYAKKSRYGGIVAPPTFATTFGFESKESVMAGLDINYARLLHGEQEYEYFKPIKAGDVISFSTKITDITEKQGKSGAMDIVTTEMTGNNQDGEKVFVGRSTVVIRH